MSQFELRTLSAQHCELRAVQGEDGEQRPPMIIGYGAVFNLRSELLGGQFVEEIAPGAFDDVLTQDVRGLFNHNPTYLLGRLPNGTLRLSVDARGLRYEIDPPDTQTVRDLVLTPLARGDMTGSSFTMRVAEDEWRQEGDLIVRTIRRISELRDVGPVAFPAYPDASAAQRSLDAWKHARDEGSSARANNERDARARELDLIGA
ncbi:HK97 family phage prohead protease [Pseudomonas putida]|uniref:HK97 family phage prohead protease n=1 Tax=Pseudomonas putida TaxID=303 RepID=UPI00370C926E